MLFEKETIVLLIIAVSVVMTILAFFVIILAGNFYRINSNQDFKIGLLTKERERIAKDFHDDINPTLASLKLRLGLAVEKLESVDVNVSAGQYDLKNSLDEISRLISLDLVDNTMAKIRSIINELIEQFDLKLELEQIKNESMRHGMDLQINFNYMDIDTNSISMEFKDNLRKIIREILTNAFKYSEASLLKIKLCKQNDHLLFIYSDNGIGFIKNKSTNGMGLRNIESRINFYSGELYLETAIGKGVHYKIRFPIEQTLK